MTPRQLRFHLAAVIAGAAGLAGVLLAGLVVLPRLGCAARLWAALGLAGQAALLLVVIGAAIFNLHWGFPTARPMWLLMAAATLTGWLIPLAAWAFHVWQEEARALDADRARMRTAAGGRKKRDSAPKDSALP